MTNITIKINTDNAAFEDWREETARILRKLADDTENGKDLNDLFLMDHNGNKVGIVQ